MFATGRKQSVILVLITLMASMRFAFPALAVAPTNIITYQGRLLNANSVPVSDASLSMKFFFYTAVTGGTCVWSNSSATCDSNTPASTTARTVTLTSGLFTQNLGDTTDSFAAISDSTFADNTTLFLEVIVGSETLSPRRRLTAAPYALNSQTLDGLSSGDFLRDNGDSATGTYSFSGAVSFDGATTFTTDADMTLATTENLTITNSTATAEVIDMTVTAAGNDAQEINFTLGNDTDVDTLAALDVIVTSAATSDADILVGLNIANLNSADTTVIERGVVIGSGWDVNLLFADTTTIIDVSNGGSLTFRDGTNTLMTLTDSGSAGTLSVGDLSCTDCLDFAELADSLTLDAATSITGAAGNTFGLSRTLTNAAAESAMSITVTASDTTSGTTSQSGLFLSNAASTEAVDGLLTINNVDDDDVVGAGVLFSAGGVGINFNYGIDFDAANIGTADIRFENAGTLDEGTTGTWTFDRVTAGTVTLQATDDDTTTALTVSSSGTGILTLDPTGAGSVALGSADVTAMTFTTDNNANSDFSFIGGATFNDDVNITAGASEVFSIVRTLTDATAENSMALAVTASDTTSSTAQQNGFIIDNLASTEALDAMIVLNNSDADDTVVTGILFSPGATGTDFTYGIDLDPANIGTADIRFENAGTLDEGTLGTWTFDRSTAGTVTLQATDDDTTTALTVSSSGAGLLTLDPTGAGSIAIGSADVTSISFTTDNNAVTDLAFTGGSTFNADSLTNVNAIMVSADSLTTGFGLQVERADSVTDFDGANPGTGGLVYINQANDNATSDGEALFIRNLGGGSSTGFFLVQNGVDAPAANTVSQQAMVLDVNEAAGDAVADEDVFTIRSDADGTPDTEFKVQLDGDIVYDGTASSPASDLAEVYPSNEILVAGDVVALDTNAPGKIKKTSTSYEAKLFGAISTKPAVRMGSEIVGYDVALTGRVSVKVSSENGAIAVGDPLTSSGTPGYAMKATEPGMIVGFALETHATGLGVIAVFVDAQWYAGNILTTDGVSTLVTDNVVVSSFATATDGSPTFDSYGLSLRGSAWNGSQAQAVEMMMKNVVESKNNYRLSVRNTSETEVAYITQTGTMKIAGDMVIGGKLYPSDRGVPQTQKYIYYDGSSGAAGDFMRTNAKGWSTGSYDFAEMFPSDEALVSGEVVVFSGSGHDVKRATGLKGEQLAGIVSTRPGFLAGENVEGSYPIALAGRVPTKVSTENGAIAVGDPLASSTTTGVAVKATESGQIVGHALEAYSGTESDDLILVYVNIGYWAGDEPRAAIVQNSASEISGNTNFSALNMSGNVSMNSYEISGIGKLAGMGEAWSLAADGTLTTQGLLKTVIDSYQNEKVETVAVTSPEVMITLTGTAILENDQLEIRFEDVIPEYNDVISADAPIRVLVTPHGPVSLYVSESDQNHFVVTRFQGDLDVEFDWMVSAYRKGYEPMEEEISVIASPAQLDEAISEGEIASSPEAPRDDTDNQESTEDPASPASPDEILIDPTTDIDGGATAEPPIESL